MIGSSPPGTLVAAGRYALFAGGIECGGEEWRIDLREPGFVAVAEQVTSPPHPFPSRQEWRATLSEEWRVESLEIVWSVGDRRVLARHAASGGRWHVRIDYAGHVREQQGDYPAACEIGFASPLFSTFALRHYVVEPGAMHAYPALFVGPPYMAVEPGHEQLRCDEASELETAFGRVRARRVVSTRTPGDESAETTLWIDEHDIVLEAYDGPGRMHPWTKLLEYHRAARLPA